MEYIICFCENFELENRLYHKGSVIKVSEEGMFKWMERAHVDKVKISIYKCNMVCDLS